MIRRAIPADTDKIMSLWFRENAAAHSFIPRCFWENCAEMVRTELLPAAETFVFCDKRQIKGFISLLNGDYVGALFVREDCQGKGIGLRLLEYVRRRRPRLSLHAYIRNAGALCFTVAADSRLLQKASMNKPKNRKSCWFGAGAASAVAATVFRVIRRGVVMPKISVITVCYNEPEVKRTCDSILGQSSGDYEWLVIDGGSAGKCIETLREFADKMTLFVSEKDNGIYDAMNKGIARARGEYLIFMNAGDVFFTRKSFG